jgi:hypothetical protein
MSQRTSVTLDEAAAAIAPMVSSCKIMRRSPPD